MKLLADHTPQFALQSAVETILGTLDAIDKHQCSCNIHYISENFGQGAELCIEFDESRIAIDYKTYTTIAISYMVANLVGGFNKKIAWTIGDHELIDNSHTGLYSQITLKNPECGDVVIYINQSLPGD